MHLSVPAQPRSGCFRARSAALAAIAFVALALVSACSAPSEESSGNTGTNTVCPMMGTAVDPQYTVVFEGRKVGFCCETCVSDWAKMSDAERREMVATMH